MREFTTTINEDGSLTIPPEILESIGINPGSSLVVLRYDDSMLVLQSSVIYHLNKLHEAIEKEVSQEVKDVGVCVSLSSGDPMFCMRSIKTGEDVKKFRKMFNEHNSASFPFADEEEEE